MEYAKKVNDINKNDEYIPYLTVEEDDEKFINTVKIEAKREEQIRSIKALYENGASLELISKANNMTIEEIEKILKSEEE